MSQVRWGFQGKRAVWSPRFKLRNAEEPLKSHRKPVLNRAFRALQSQASAARYRRYRQQDCRPPSGYRDCGTLQRRTANDIISHMNRYTLRIEVLTALWACCVCCARSSRDAVRLRCSPLAGVGLLTIRTFKSRGAHCCRASSVSLP
jgi:hypothetical protein